MNTDDSEVSVRRVQKVNFIFSTFGVGRFGPDGSGSFGRGWKRMQTDDAEGIFPGIKCGAEDPFVVLVSHKFGASLQNALSSRGPQQRAVAI